MNAVAAVASSPVLQVSPPPVAIGPEMTAALLLATAGAIALFWFSVKMVAGFREYRQVVNDRENEEATDAIDGDDAGNAERLE